MLVDFGLSLGRLAHHAVRLDEELLRERDLHAGPLLEVVGLVGSGDGACAILEELALDFVAPVGRVEAEVLLDLLWVPIGDRHWTWSCSDGQPLAMMYTCCIHAMLHLWPHTHDHKTSK
jgi:hypothetical protein